MENLQAIIMGWVAIQTLGIGGLIWRSINLYFDFKALQKQVEFLDKRTLLQSERLEEKETKIDNKFDDMTKIYYEMREFQNKQQSSLEHIKTQLALLLEKKMDSNN